LRGAPPCAEAYDFRRPIAAGAPAVAVLRPGDDKLVDALFLGFDYTSTGLDREGLALGMDTEIILCS